MYFVNRNLFIVFYVHLVIWSFVQCSNEYGVQLELLSIVLTSNDDDNFRQDSLQYELKVETRKSGISNVHLLGNVLLQTVRGKNELVFPEVTGKNPFHVSRLESGDTLCLHLEQNLITVVEDCQQIKDYSSTYYSSENFFKNLTDGSILVYKLVQYLLKADDFSSFKRDITYTTTATDLTSSTLTSGKTESSSSPVCSPCHCTVPIVFASLEGAVLLALLLLGLYYLIFVFYPRRKPSVGSSPKRKPRPTITVIRPGSDVSTVQDSNDTAIYSDSGVSSISSRVVAEPYMDCANSDVSAPTQNHHVSNTMRTIPNKLKTSTLSVSSTVNIKLGEASESVKNTLKSTGQALATTGRQIKEKVNAKAKSMSNVAPPLPPPPDYPPTDRMTNTNSDVAMEDEEDDFYDVIELDEVDETTKQTPPKIPENKPISSFLHQLEDASDARTKSKKFSYHT